MKLGVLSSKEEIVRRATCKFVRNFHPPLALVPSRQEKQDTVGRGRRRMRPSRRRRRARGGKGTRDGRRRVFCSWLLAIYAPEIARPPWKWNVARKKGRKREWRRRGRGRMVAREGERAVDFLREVLSHDLVAARKVENTAGIREETGMPLRRVSMTPQQRSKQRRFCRL